MTIHAILRELRAAATSNRDLGDRFEQLMVSYLKLDPMYAERFSNVWLWTDWPGRNSQPDTGIDLVAEERATGSYCAIQCKFYDPKHTLEKKDIDSFFTASGTADFSSRFIISTTDKWSKHAESALSNQQIPVTRLRVQDLDDSPVDWSQFSLQNLKDIKLKEKKKLRPHQTKALNNVTTGFQNHDRGKLIMACGTGKTYTSLKIAETFAADQKASVLFLVPSIALLSQTLREWTAEVSGGIHSIAVCSDKKVGKQKKKSDSEDISTHDLAFPATTDAATIAARAEGLDGQKGLTVVFSTYQSIQAISEAQTKGLADFDLIICDEAHRTTGITLQGDDESHFVRVHDQNFIKGKKRLYMTATPRLYGDTAKSKALENDIEICSMDDKDIYGPEFHRLGFGEAVGSGLLSDYRVMVLAVDEKYVSSTFQQQLADKDNELNLEDAVKITGCWNGLSKRMAVTPEGEAIEGDLSPMRRAVAFTKSIKDSKRIVELFGGIVDEYIESHPDEGVLTCRLDHVDGTQNSLLRHSKLDWLKADTRDQGNVCRILSNVRCLSEGVDVPALDAVMFLTPRNSVVDVVQSVGRVMRKAPGKDYGYIILPVGIPADMPPEQALKDNDRYRVIWQVLQALRAHDDRFNSTINKLDLNNNPPPQIEVIGVGGGEDDAEGAGSSSSQPSNTQLNLSFPQLDEWRDAIYAKIVTKCGDRRYWETWAKDVAQIADSHISRIKSLLESAEPTHREAFDEFLVGLHQNINPNVSESDAIEMLSQHLITKPVFDALFEGYAFTEQNPVSISMQRILSSLQGESLAKDATKLEAFYTSVRERASGIDSAEGKQRIITELYDKFFRSAFPKLTERLGIVYTPVEVVDFILRSTEQALQKEFGVSLSDEGVNVLDPFTGTGTFIVRLLQSGLIRSNDLHRKFKHELHANEIVLLAYYIAAVNIEEAYHELKGTEYKSFEGIVLTDTFQMFEKDGTLIETMFPENNERVSKQKQCKIQVIMANPPYSAGQGSENDSNKNLKYEQLDSRIRETYVEHSTATLKSRLYASEIRAMRWASDRIVEKGIVCYVINGSFISSNSADGIRKCLVDEFDSIYCFNLRGNQRTQGEKSRQEGGKIFAAGSRASIAIILLIKNPVASGECQLFYKDIGDYLSREEKLSNLQNLDGIKDIDWEIISPNSSYDWINQRDPKFDHFLLLGDKKDQESITIFNLYSGGVKTNRDAWCYSFSKDSVAANMSRMIDFYNRQVEEYQASEKISLKVEKFINTDAQKISWSRSLKKNLQKGRSYDYESQDVVVSTYRPFCKQNLYFNRDFNEVPGKFHGIFPNRKIKNLVICVTGTGANRDFSALITDVIPNFHFHDTGQCFPLYTYTKQSEMGSLFENSEQDEYLAEENVCDSTLADFQSVYDDDNIGKEDIFYYVYGILHSKEYKTRFAPNLSKILARIPYAEDFWIFSEAGRNLSYQHLNYETVEPYPLDEYGADLFSSKDDYRVIKMSFGKRGRDIDKATIVYNSRLTIGGIPSEAHRYIVNGQSALEWIIERYRVTIDKKSGIKNDPNDWSDNPRYIVELLKRIVSVSIETVKIIDTLPALNERN